MSYGHASYCRIIIEIVQLPHKSQPEARGPRFQPDLVPEAFHDALMLDFDSIMASVAQIDAEKADARNPRDKA